LTLLLFGLSIKVLIIFEDLKKLIEKELT